MALNYRIVCFAVLMLATLVGTSNADCVAHVDPLIGTAGDGNVFPGPTLPWGFIQPGPDTGPGSGAGGYKFDKNINGFSQQHISGLGGPLYGEISLMPLVGEVADPTLVVSTGKSDENSSPGYYSVRLAPWDVKVELTSSRTVAFQRQTYPAHSAARLVIDVGHCLYGQGHNWNSAIATGGSITASPDGKELSGHMTYQGGRTTNKPWTVYFVTRVDAQASSVATWGDDTKPVANALTHEGARAGVVLTFNTNSERSILARTAVSWRSIQQARGYLDTTDNLSFEDIHKAAVNTWESVLGKIAVESGNSDDLKRFYTALYHAQLAPNDWTNESPERYGSRTYYENQLCMWDQFRTVIPLLTLIEPKVSAGIVNSIINYFQLDGWTGDAHSAHQYEHMQNGSSADVIIADAFVKHLPGIRWDDAYAAIRKNAFVDANPNAKGRPKLGRLRLNDYRQFHYLPIDTIVGMKDVQAVSRTLEYIYDDFCVLTLAKSLGAPQDLGDLQSRLLWYKNLWEPTGGFMRGKTSDGKWIEPFDPLKSETGKAYYEGHAWTWSWYVPHDTQGLINLHGGDDAFVAKLTTACNKYYEAFNEPCMLETYLFIHAGRPDLTQHFARQALQHFTTTHQGLPGNDDSGTTSAWVVWTMLGIYPNAGQPYYYIGSPMFPKATIDVGGGKSFVLSAPETSEKNVYVQSATLNGKPWQQAWLSHETVVAGGNLVLEMGPKPSAWGRDVRPPSLSNQLTP